MDASFTDEQIGRFNEAHRHSSKNLDEIKKSTLCRCFYCEWLFRAEFIKEWIDVGQTALCPQCHIDSVIGDASGIPLDDEFFKDMAEYWFGWADWAREVDSGTGTDETENPK